MSACAAVNAPPSVTVLNLGTLAWSVPTVDTSSTYADVYVTRPGSITIVGNSSVATNPPYYTVRLHLPAAFRKVGDAVTVYAAIGTSLASLESTMLLVKDVAGNYWNDELDIALATPLTFLYAGNGNWTSLNQTPA